MITPWLVVLIERLAAAGVNVEVLAPSYRGLGTQTINGVRVHRFRYAPERWEDLTHDQTAPDRVRSRPGYLSLVPPYVLSGCFAAARLARRKRYDVVHAFWPVPHALLGIAAQRAARVPLVLTFFGVELSWLRSDFPVLAPLVRRMIASADGVTAISSTTAAEVRRLAPSVEPVLIPFGAAVDAPPRAGGAGAAKAEVFTLLFVGRLVERKGLHVLLRALSLLRPHRRLFLDVIGEGPMRVAWERQAADLGLDDLVRFHGWVDAERLSSLLLACDSLVLPAVTDSKGDTEGLGVVLIEALSAGRPVIASASGGIVDIVRHGETGLLVPPGDAPGLAGAIEAYMDDPELARRHAAAGRVWVEKQFSWDAIVGRLIALYGTLAERARTVAGPSKDRGSETDGEELS